MAVFPIILSSPLLLLFVVVLQQHVNCEDQSAEEIESILGLDETNIRSRMDNLYSLIDTNNDTIVTEEELHMWLTIAKEAVQNKQAIDELEHIDTDHDGKVTFDEMKQSYAESDGTPVSGKELDDLKKRFDMVDEDKDGALSLNEIGMLMSPHSSDSVMSLEVDTIFESDANNDGKISVHEFMAVNEDVSEEELKRFEPEFDMYDKNGDGFIDRGELIKVISNPFENEIMESKAHLRKLATEARCTPMADFHLSKKDWNKGWKKFALSPMTDGGEMLRSPSYYNLPVEYQNLSRDSDLEDNETEASEEL